MMAARVTSKGRRLVSVCGSLLAKGERYLLAVADRARLGKTRHFAMADPAQEGAARSDSAAILVASSRPQMRHPESAS